MKALIYINVLLYLLLSFYELNFTQASIFLWWFLSLVLCLTILLARPRLLSLDSAVLIGLLIPLLISAFPVSSYYTLVADTTSLSFKLCLPVVYIAVIISRALPTGGAMHYSNHLTENSINSVGILGVLFLILGMISFFSLSVLNGFNYPISSQYVTEAAFEFFIKLNGAATIYSLGDLGCIFITFYCLFNEKYRKLAIFVVVVFLITKITVGKRMGFFILFMTILILIDCSRPNLLTIKRKVLALAAFVIVFFVNAYLRASYAYYEFYEGFSYFKLDNMYEFIMLQPVLYIQPNFVNLEDIFNFYNENRAEYQLGLNSLPFIVEDSFGYLSVIRDRAYNVPTFLGRLYSDFGYLSYLFISIFFFVVIQLNNLARNNLFFLFIYISILLRVYFFFFDWLLFENNVFYSAIILIFLSVIFYKKSVV